MIQKERAENIYRILEKAYPDARCTLDVGTPERFLFANILSPQCTDIVVNKVAKRLLKEYPEIGALAGADVSDLIQIIRPCGLQNVKSRNLMNSAKMLVEDHGGKLPSDLDLLTRFPGIGRKTALVILSEAFGIVDGIIVDTHNIRIANRVGLTGKKNADSVEKDLMKVIPEDNWRMWSHLIVFHGRNCCTARNPKCPECPVADFCEYGSNSSHN